MIVRREFCYILYASSRTTKNIRNVSLAFMRKNGFVAEAFANYDSYSHICLCKSKLSNSSHLLPICLQVASADFTNKRKLCFFPVQLA